MDQSIPQFSASSYSVAESAGVVPLLVQRIGDTTADVAADFTSADGTATNGLKYTAVSGTLAFGAGETNHTILPILDNGWVDGTKNFPVILGNLTGDAFLGIRTIDHGGGAERLRLEHAGLARPS